MKQVLIPTDFSANAWNTILYAMELFKNIPCEFHILNTYEVKPTKLVSTVSSQRVGYYYDAIKIESEEGLEMILEDISSAKPDPKHAFKTVSKSGSLVEIVQKMTSDTHFDMIVIGTKGATGAKEIFLGSNTHRIIKNINNCPILVVPDDVFFENISNIAFATNFEKVYYRSEIAPILDMAKKHNASIRMIHVYDEPGLDIVQTYNSSSLERYFKNVKHDFHVIHDFSNLEKAIQSFVEELEIDVLVMINYEHSFIERLVRESVIKKITFHTTIPFLVIPSDN